MPHFHSAVRDGSVDQSSYHESVKARVDGEVTSAVLSSALLNRDVR